ncbi:hypothetical protein NP493_291g03001 [Ridgeia piscesae]|uniref:Fucolectin tachylectin-4 pentraxin-1 domain-containing protein n=1 Tax=Ridgeia piscesae TaxID=27915 RepID=A0AAD9NWV7_RIDPI|nr:hypothetical protein NP493_291g03001 [Ridgeia piscesae]
MSGSQGWCIFPCRCTDGCNTTTGDCLHGGRCEDGYPSGYRWSGPGCQTEQYSANKAVDGNTDQVIEHGYCAHPDADGGHAWWMVDLGNPYSISKVAIHNRDVRPERLDTFTLSVGDSPDRSTHTECASHNGPVAAGATVNETCTAVGRYLSFRRDGVEAYVAGLCEVVVIGHEHISCQECPAISACNDITGCDICVPGKQQPDCVKECEIGTYGKNCEEDCGHCKENTQCDVKNGHCATGCETWYTPNTCKEYIHVVRDEEDYEPTAAAENENEYEQTTPVPVRDDYVNVNVYDMIKN